MDKLYFIGLTGHQKIYCPWLCSLEPLEVVDGKVLMACKSTLAIFNTIPEQIRLNPQLDTWMVARSEDGLYFVSVYFSKDFKRIQDINEGMRYSWDVLFCSGKEGIEKGELTFEDRDTRVDYSPAIDYDDLLHSPGSAF